MDITNKSGKPLNVPLPGGKRLFLGPGKTGQVTPKALEHPALAKLIEAGDLETSAGGAKHQDGGPSRPAAHPGPGHAGRVPRRPTGDL
jgi:hypothetical protein